MKHRLLDLKHLKFEVRDIMRYDDVGDYFGNTIIAYDFKDDVITNAIFIHEFIEYTLIKSAGITPELIDAFDTDDDTAEKYPKEYELYEKFHEMANAIERRFIENLGLNWKEHEEKLSMAKVKTAVSRITQELHKQHPDSTIIDSSKEIVKKEMGEGSK